MDAFSQDTAKLSLQHTRNPFASGRRNSQPIPLFFIGNLAFPAEDGKKIMFSLNILVSFLIFLSMFEVENNGREDVGENRTNELLRAAHQTKEMQMLLGLERKDCNEDPPQNKAPQQDERISFKLRSFCGLSEPPSRTTVLLGRES